MTNWKLTKHLKVLQSGLEVDYLVFRVLFNRIKINNPTITFKKKKQNLGEKYQDNLD